MATRPTPDPDGPAPDWRALLAALPDGDDEPPPGASWHTRRRWRRTRAREARRKRADAVTELRHHHMSPVAMLLVVVLVLILGAVSRCGGRPGDGEDGRPPAPARNSPAAAPAPPGPQPPVQEDAAPDDVAAAWVRAYLTRDPQADQDHRASAQRAAQWATADLTRNLTNTVPLGWGRQVSRGESTRVTAAAARPAGPDLPPDNPAQMWRVVAATVDVTGYDRSRRTDTLSVEVSRTTIGWRVSRVLGV
ncbi:hypothetical protein ACFV0B_37890 [Streptomyces xanthophaeus]|uniref:hypothetical protein n=1 Tax=Streptomyces xanthophaeus TaxID=67385 RepID=UPI0036C7687F